MTDRQKELVRDLRLILLRLGYPPIVIVDNETLEAVEQNLTEWLESYGRPPILSCGMNGLWFKGCELVLKVEEKKNV